MKTFWSLTSGFTQLSGHLRIFLATSLLVGVSFSPPAGAILQAAPFPSPDLVRLSTNLTGVSTWPGYRQPSYILDMDVQGNRVALAGANLGALVMERGDRSIQRFVSPTIGSSGKSVALLGNLCLLSDVGNPEAHWFGVAGPMLGLSGNLPEEIGFGVASLGDFAVVWTLANTRDKTYLRTYTDGVDSQPAMLAEWVLPSSVADVQLFELAGQKFAVILHKPANTWQILRLEAGGSLPLGNISLPNSGARLRVNREGRALVTYAQSGVEKIRLYRIDLSDSTPLAVQTGEMIVPDLNILTVPVQKEDLLVIQVGHPNRDALELFDISNPASPVKLANLPLPEADRYGNEAHLHVLGDTLFFVDHYGAFQEADLSDPEQPRWVYNQVLTGQTDALRHNGNLLVATEGSSEGLRVVDISSPEHPITQATIALAASNASEGDRLAFSRHVAYSISRGGAVWLEAIDISRPLSPRIDRRKLNISGQGHSLATDRDTLVLAEDAALFVYSLLTPEHPVLVSKIAGNFSSSYLALNAGYLYVASRLEFRVYDVRVPQQPILVKTLDVRTDAADNPLLEGTRLWVTGRDTFARLSKLSLFDISEEANPRFERGLAFNLGQQDDRILPVGRHLLYTTNVSTRVNTPWGTDFTSKLQSFELAGEETTLSIGTRVAEMIFRQWEGDGIGRTTRFHPPHVVGDLILLPLGQHGFDVVRADFLPRTAPVIKHQPRPLKVATGRRAVFSATVDGALPLTYQWFKGEQPLTNSARIFGANSLFLVIPAAEPADAGTYTLRVNNSEGEIFSLPTALEVVAARPLALQLVSTGSNAWRAEISGNPGLVTRVEWSDDLVTWYPEETTGLTADIALPDGSASADLKVRSGKQRFYRAVVIYPN